MTVFLLAGIFELCFFVERHAAWKGPSAIAVAVVAAVVVAAARPRVHLTTRVIVVVAVAAVVVVVVGQRMFHAALAVAFTSWSSGVEFTKVSNLSCPCHYH